MNYERLEKNLTDNIREAQLKLGFENRPMSLNYMYSSLRHLLGTDCSDVELSAALDGFAEHVLPRLGRLGFRPVRDGCCITIPAEGTAYVHDSTTGDEFIAQLVSAVRGHDISMEDVIDLFRRSSDNVTVQDGNGEDFDKMVCFADGVPDEYLYCLTAEPCMDGGCHIIYHRFIREDYEDLGF